MICKAGIPPYLPDLILLFPVFYFLLKYETEWEYHKIAQRENR